MSFTDKFLDLFLLSAGVIRDSNYRIYERIITATITIASSVTWCGTLVAAVNISKVADKCETLFYLVSIPTCYLASYHTRNNRLKLSKFVEHIRKLGDDGDNDVMKKIDTSYQNILKKVLIALYVTLILVLMPVWTALFWRGDYHNRNMKSYIPHWFECAENVTARGFTINVFCLRVDSYSERVSSNFIQGTLFFLYTVPASNAILFYVFIYHYVKFYRQHLVNSLDQICARRELALFTRGERSPLQIQSDLLDVMKQYQSLRRRVTRIF